MPWEEQGLARTTGTVAEQSGGCACPVTENAGPRSMQLPPAQLSFLLKERGVDAGLKHGEEKRQSREKQESLSALAI